VIPTDYTFRDEAPRGPDLGAAPFVLHPSLSEEEFAFAEGDQIEVLGSKIKFEGRDILVAREMKKGDLRNRQGSPVWSRSQWRY
jgi:hypothetical protein